MTAVTPVTDVLGNLDCSAGQKGLLVVTGLIGLAIAFAGYRMYVLCIGVCGFLVALSIEAAIGGSWIGEKKETDDHSMKIAVVAVCCLVWGCMGAVCFTKMHRYFERSLGGVMGAALGLAIVAAVVYLIDGNLETPSEFANWQGFAVLTLGIPVAALVGYYAQNMLVYFMMMGTAIGGAIIAAGSLIGEVGVFLGIAALGLACQCYTSPPKDGVLSSSGSDTD